MNAKLFSLGAKKKNCVKSLNAPQCTEKGNLQQYVPHQWKPHRDRKMKWKERERKNRGREDGREKSGEEIGGTAANAFCRNWLLNVRVIGAI